MESNSHEVVAGELVPVPRGPVTLFGVDDPDLIVEHAANVARSLAKVIRDQKLYVSIRGNDHVRVEGWTLLGSMLGVFPVLAWTRKLDDGWEACVEAKTMAGVVVGAAEAECLRSETRWRDADDYAIRSMAQTRATSKALRQPLGFVITLAGFQTTPAEEVPAVEEPAVASQKQLREIKRLLEEAPPGEDWAAEVRAVAGGKPGTKLTVAQADAVIAHLTELVEQLDDPVVFEVPAGVQPALPDNDE